MTCFDQIRGASVFGTGILNTEMAPGNCDVPFGDRTDVCIIAAESITIEGNATWRGSRPLVLWSATTITVLAGATLDVGSHAQNNFGAGANDASCPLVDGKGDTTTAPQLGAGGCGGSFSGLGGVGGAARSSQGISVVVSTSCTPMVQQLDRVRGGCRGGHGGNSNSVGSLNGGASGGAVYLMAKGDIIVLGKIDARGTQGHLANSNTASQPGGGGGGSGGMIGFDTDSSLILGDDAVLVATGGGGSSGAGLNAAGNSAFQGNEGREGSSVAPLAFAQKSAATVANNFGGAGAFNGEAGGSVDPAATGGGGGGAGGVGYIRAYPKLPLSTTTAAILPPLTAP